MTGLLESAVAAIRAEMARTKLGVSDIFTTGQRIAELAQRFVADPDPDVPTQRIAVIGSLTTDFLVRGIACAVVQEGILPVIYEAPFGSYTQQVLDRGSGLHRFHPNLVVIAPDWHVTVDGITIDTPAAVVAELTAAKAHSFAQLWDIIEHELGARVLQHVLVPPVYRFCGIAERLAPASPRNQVLALTHALLEAGRGRVSWVEMDRLAEQAGASEFADERSYLRAKLPFGLAVLPDYLPAFRAAWRCATSRTKKALVLDLDNTLWGGIIGDDGVAGLALGPGSGAGEAFVSWARYLQQLAARGVVLAVCSKNNPEIAISVFDHEHMVLRRSDFAAFHCSWNDKASGLRQIASELNLGLESLVFADDNPAECELIQTALPDVGIVHLGADPTRFIERLDRGQWFDLPQYTAEDTGRGAAYAARAQAQAERNAAADIDSYLTGLRMVAALGRATPSDLPRLAQMEQKTNQFNLTTRRYSEDALAALLRHDDAIVLRLRLYDKFGDHGLVASLIALHEGDALRIDSWVMSCRVFSRTVEQFMMSRLVEIACTLLVSRIVGEYLPTKKNGVVADLFYQLGFKKLPGGAFWELALADWVAVLKFNHFIGAAPAEQSMTSAPAPAAVAPLALDRRSV